MSNADLVVTTVATALGVKAAAGSVTPARLATSIGPKRLLLLLDNCEHVIGAAAGLAETLLRAGPAIHLMATSREALDVEGEHIFQVPPLAIPAQNDHATDHILQHSAVQLFISRAQAAAPDFAPDAAAVATIGAICRHLDGIPLAIELAAPLAATLGVSEIYAHLNERFRLLAGGRRTARLRHQTLRAALDWSYDLLTVAERTCLRCLAIFAGMFSLEAATAVGTSTELATGDVVDCVTHLVAKSLLVADLRDGATWYRLLETTRAYAREKLAESGELPAVARRHAGYVWAVVARAAAESETRPFDAWLADYRNGIDDVRAALDWSFSPDGDATIGVQITAEAVPLWLQMSLMEECQQRCERALASIAAGSAWDEMRLQAALATSLISTRGPGPEVRSAWMKVLGIAEQLGDARYRLGAMDGLWVFLMNRGEFRDALILARRYRAMTRNAADPAGMAVGDRMIGMSLHYQGNQVGARRRIERMLDHQVAPARRSPTAGAQLDPQVTARITLARILWLQGFPDQATQMAQTAAADAQTRDHVVLQCFALAWSLCPVAIFTGDLALAQNAVTRLLELTTNHGLGSWGALARYYQAKLAIGTADAAAGLPALRAAFDDLRERQFTLAYSMCLGDLAEISHMTGRLADASRRSRRRSNARSATKNVGAPPICCVSKPSLCCHKTQRTQRRQPNGFFSRPWPRRATRVRCRGNCALPQRSRDCGATRPEPGTRTTFSRRSTVGSPRGSRPPTSKRRRHCFTVSCKTWKDDRARQPSRVRRIVDQRLRRPQVGGSEPLGEAPVDRCQQRRPLPGAALPVA